MSVLDAGYETGNIFDYDVNILMSTLRYFFVKFLPIGTTKVKFLVKYINPEGCLADQGQASCRMSIPSPECD